MIIHTHVTPFNSIPNYKQPNTLKTIGACLLLAETSMVQLTDVKCHGGAANHVGCVGDIKGGLDARNAAFSVAPFL